MFSRETFRILIEISLSQILPKSENHDVSVIYKAMISKVMVTIIFEVSGHKMSLDRQYLCFDDLNKEALQDIRDHLQQIAEITKETQ